MYQDIVTPEVNQLVPTFEMTSEDEPDILLDEVREVVNVMKKRKVPGCDGIEVELRQVLGENRIKTV